MIDNQTSVQKMENITAEIDSKITIKNKKGIDSIELHFDEKVQKYFVNNIVKYMKWLTSKSVSLYLFSKIT